MLSLSIHSNPVSEIIFSKLIYHFTTEKKGKFVSFLKVKSKPLQPRKPKTTFKLQTTLQSFKRRKVEDSGPEEFLKHLQEKYKDKEMPSLDPENALMANT